MLRCWWEQTYLKTELIIVSEDDLSDVIPVHPRIRFVSCKPGTTLGQKRNIACENAQGDIIAHFDDDDWSAPNRLEECVDVLLKKKVFLTGYRVARFYDVDTKLARIWDGGPLWVQGSSMCYVKTFWRTHKFLDVNSGEDLQFQKDAGQLVHGIDGINKMIFRDHSGNTWPRQIHYNKNWLIIDAISTQKLLNWYEPTKIVMGMLTWNDKDKTLMNLKALLTEADNLRKFDFDPYVVVVDNGSNDGTVEELKKIKNIHIIANKKNLGISKARNQTIKYAIKVDSEFIFTQDCDTTVVPFSVLEMIRWLRPRASQAACIGANSYCCTEDSNKAAKWCPIITNAEIQNHQAPGHYGLFFTNILNRYRYDENFGAGWGTEDNDLAMTIEDATHLKMYIFPLLFLHLHPHGSVESLKKDGVDIEKNIRERYAYFINKWKGNAEFSKIVDWVLEYKNSDKVLSPK
jgi:glycosyltransferase involved in cell wall biosynthesis